MLLEAVVLGIGRAVEVAKPVGQGFIEATFGCFDYFEPSFSVVIGAAEGHFEQLVGLEAVGALVLEAVGAVVRRDWRN